MNSWLLIKLNVGVEILVAAYGNVVVEDVPPLLFRTFFRIVIRPFCGVGEGLGVGVAVGAGVGVAVGVGVGVGAGPPPSQE